MLPKHTLPLLVGAMLTLPNAGRAQEAGGGTEMLDELVYYEFSSFASRVLGAGDLSGDGIPDFLVTGTCEHKIHAYSGADRTLLYATEAPGQCWNFGYSLAMAGDLTGDFVSEFLVGEPGADLGGGSSNSGLVFLFDGRDGALIHRFIGYRPHDALGSAVAGPDDINGDGVADLIMSAPGLGQNFGRIYARSGLDGSLLYSLTGGLGDNLGIALAVIEDMDGDGVSDFLAGHKNFIEPSNFDGGVDLYSGATGALLHTFTAPGSTEFGEAVVGLPDVDGDGVSDRAVGDHERGVRNFGGAFVFSGASRSLLWYREGDIDKWELGTELASPGDVDGTPDLLVAAAGVGGGNYPTSFVYSGSDGRLITHFDSYINQGPLALAVGVLGDLDGDGTAEMLHGRPAHHDPFLALWTFRPFLRGSALEVSAAAGGALHYEMDFPTDDAGAGYLLLASAAGRGPTALSGVSVPLTRDALFYRTLAG